MANYYSSGEYLDMIIAYGAAGENAAVAKRLYMEKFPQRQAPSEGTILRLLNRARETGSLKPRSGHDGGRPHRRPNNEEVILEMVEDNPTLSTRTVARQTGSSQWFVWHTLKMQGLHPYHYQRVQGLIPGDYPLRQRFCEWFVRYSNRHLEFPDTVLATDESCFTRDGVVNLHNMHLWSDENPHAIHQTRFQQRFSINLWAGIINNTLIGPYELPQRLNGGAYLQFLKEVLPELLEDVPLNVRRNMWFLHDGCPAHYSLSVREFLNETFPQRWIGRGGFIPWPPRSPDLNPLDFFLWGYIKEKVYATEIQNEEDLRLKINNAVLQLRQNFPPISGNWIRRAQLCIQDGGRHFEQLLDD